MHPHLYAGDEGRRRVKTGYTVNRKPAFTLTGAGTFHGALKGDISLYAVVEKEKNSNRYNVNRKPVH